MDFDLLDELIQDRQGHINSFLGCRAADVPAD